MPIHTYLHAQPDYICILDKPATVNHLWLYTEAIPPWGLQSMSKIAYYTMHRPTIMNIYYEGATKWRTRPLFSVCCLIPPIVVESYVMVAT